MAIIARRNVFGNNRTGHTQNSLLSYRGSLENSNFACSKFRYDTFQINNKGVDQTGNRLVCALVVGKPQRQVFSRWGPYTYKVHSQPSFFIKKLVFENSQQLLYSKISLKPLEPVQLYNMPSPLIKLQNKLSNKLSLFLAHSKNWTGLCGSNCFVWFEVLPSSQQLWSCRDS